MIFDLRFTIPLPLRVARRDGERAGVRCHKLFLALLLSTLNTELSTCFAFEGRITVVTTQGGQLSSQLYTIGTNQFRIESTDTNWPHAKNIVNLESGAVTLLFPHNRSFVRLKSGTGVPPVRFNGSQALENEKLTGGTPVPLPPGVPALPLPCPPCR